MVIISNSDFQQLLKTIEQLGRDSAWEKAGVVATFLAVAVALFFPLREFLTTFAKFAIKSGIPEFREGKQDQEQHPHVELSIKNRSREAIKVKELTIMLKLYSYHEFDVFIHLKPKSEIIIQPLSKEDITFLFIPPHEAYNQCAYAQQTLQTNKQVFSQYFKNITGFEKLKEVSVMIHTNLGPHREKLPKWSYLELFDQVGLFILSQDKEHTKIVNKYTKIKSAEDISTNVKKFISEMKMLYNKRFADYREKCKKDLEEEKQNKRNQKRRRRNLKHDLF